ncbi:MAG: AidA/PixA family protein [Rhizomicrobium sp.]
MSDFINISMVFDFNYLVSTYKTLSQDPTKPTGISHNGVYMITEPRFLEDAKTNATADLAIKAQPGDIVRWNAQTLSDNLSNAVVVYKLPYWKGDVVTPEPVPHVANATLPIPEKDPTTLIVNPLKPKPTTIPLYYLEAGITESSTQKTLTENYYVYFYLTQIVDSKLKILGYLYWDPSITVHLVS